MHFKALRLSIIKYIRYFFIFFVLTSNASLLYAKDTTVEVKNILTLVSYHSTHSWTENIIYGLINETKTLPYLFDFKIVELDALRTPDLQQREKIIQKCISEIKNNRYSIIVAVDDVAVDLLIKYSDEIPNDIPIIFAGYEKSCDALKQKYPNLTGVKQNFDTINSIKIAKKIFPKLKEIVIFSSPNDTNSNLINAISSEQKEILKSVNIRIFDSTGKTHEQILNYVRDLPDTTMLLVSPWQIIQSTEYENVRVLGLNLSGIAKLPYLVHSDALIGYGALGGYITDSKTHGKEIADIFKKVLKQGSAKDIPFYNGTIEPVFDFNVIKKLNIDTSIFPTNATIHNLPASFWEKYKIVISILLVLLIIILITSIAIVFLLKHNAQRDAKIFRLFPGKIGIINEKEELLFINSDDKSEFGAKKLSDLKNIDYQIISAEVSKAIKSNKLSVFDYEFNDNKKIVTLSPVPFEIFRQKAIMITSQNNSELQGTRIELERASQLTRSAPFKIDLNTNKISGTKMLTQLWPTAGNNISFSPEKWVYPEDVKTVKEKIENLKCGKSFEEIFTFRSTHFGDMRYYRILLSNKNQNDNKELMSGVIQDITEIQKSVGILEETLQLWDIVINSIPITFFVKDATDNFKYILCNNAFADFLDVKKEYLIGKTDSELFDIKKEAEFYRNCDIETMQNPQWTLYTEVSTDSKGLQHTMKTVKKPFFSPTGKRLLIGATIDVTDMNNLITCEHINGEILQKTVNEPEFNNVIDIMSESLIREIKCDNIVVTKCNNGLLRFYRENISNDSEPLSDEGLNYFNEIWDTNLETMKRNQVIKVSDIKTNHLTKKIKDSNITIKSFIAVPIFVNEILWGSILVSFSNFKKDFSSAEENLMRSCANIIALAVIRHKQRRTIEISNEEKQTILNNIRIPICLHDDKGELIRANTAVGKLLNMSVVKFTTEQNRKTLAASLNDIFPNDDVLTTNKPFQCEVKYKNRDYIVNSDPIFDKNKKLVYILKSAIDVTEINEILKNQNAINFCLENILRSNNFNLSIENVLNVLNKELKSTRCAIFQINVENKKSITLEECPTNNSPLIFPKDVTEILSYFKVLAKNAAFENATSIEAKEFFGSNWPNFAKENNIDSIYTKRIFLKNKVWGYASVIFENGKVKLKKRQIELIRACARILEIMFERQESQEKIFEALRKAQAADKAKSFFIASVSHEIRTPLNAVIGFSELLRDTNISNEKRNEYLNSIAYAGNALLQLINDVLDLSKLEADQMEIIPEQTDFKVLANEVLKMFAHKAMEKNIELIEEIPEIESLYLDKLRIRQILVNFIGNAIKFTNQGSVKLWANLKKTTNELGDFSFGVTDTGIGIDKKNQNKLMEPFVQISKLRGTNATLNGTGLGLSISKRLAEKMGGKIYIESDIGKGSTFYITMANVRLNSDVSNLIKDIQINEESKSLPSSVLIVDDVEMNLKVMQAMCSKIGIKNITCMKSPKDALNTSKEIDFDVIFTDFWMPEFSGVEFAKRIKSFNKKIPVIAVTADIEIKDSTDIQFFDGVLFKPVTIQKIKDAINKINTSTDTQQVN